MKILFQLLTRVFLISLVLMGPFAYSEEGGTLEVQGKKLILNGAATFKFSLLLVKVPIFESKFYLEVKSSNPAEIINSDSIKVNQMKFFREVSGEQFASGTRDSFKKRCRDKPCKILAPDVEKFIACFKNSTIHEGDVIIYTLLKNEVVIELGKSDPCHIESTGLGKYFLIGWVGEDSTQSSFRDGLLGL